MKHIHEILSSSDKHKNVYKVILQPLDVYDTDITLQIKQNRKERNDVSYFLML